MSWRTKKGGAASARVAVDASDNATAGLDRQPNRGSLQYSSVVDAVVSEHDEDDNQSIRLRRRTRHGHRLSIEDQLKIRRTSALLTNPHLHALVRSQREKTRLERLKEKIFDRPHTISPSPPAAQDPEREQSEDGNKLTQLRKWLRVHIKTRAFRAILYSVVLLDVVALALDERTTEEITPYTFVDVLCTVLLFLEIAVKSFAFGWFTGANAYFTRSKRAVRLLNVAMLVLSLLSYAIGYDWRILRGLKTVRCLTLYAGLRRIMRSLARAIPFLANVSTLALFFLFAFSIFGLEAYKGAFSQQCRYDDPEVANNETFWTALPTAYCSVNSSCQAPLYCDFVPPSSAHVNFDSGLSSLFLVFLVVAQDGWVGDIMRPVVEATSRLSALYFVAIIASMVFLVVNLFVAVITTSFMNFSVDSARAKENTKDEDDEEEAVNRTRGSMIKMDPLEEATRVSLIMGATLAIEGSIQQQQQQAQPDGDGNDGREPTKFARLLARTHHYHTLRDFTVDATLDLLQNSSPVDEFLLGPGRRGARGSAMTPGVVGDSRRDDVQEDGEEDKPSAPPSPSNDAKPTTDSVPQPNHHLTKLLVNHAPFSSLTDVLQKEGRTDSVWFTHFQRVVLSKRFDDLITACIVVNTAFLMVEYRTMPDWVRTMLSVVEYFFGAVFLAEMIARIIAMRGVRRYLHSTERFFDMIVVICTSVNIVLNNLPSVDFSGLNSVSSLRTLRVSRLMLKWEGTRKLIESVLKSSRGVMDVVAFLILFQVVSSIMAMQLFGGGHMTQDGQSPRWNFDTFPRSFLTLLQVITADQWASITYDAVNADDPHPLLVPFLIINFIIGQHVLLNLFIAVILENFAISEEEAYQLQLEQIIAIPKELDIYEKIEEEGVRAFGEMEQLDNVSNVKLRMFLGLDAEAGENGGGGGSGDDGHPHQPKETAPSGTIDRVLSLGRRACLRVTRSSVFQRVVQLMILVSCVTLMLDDPHPEIHVELPSEDRLLALTICNRVALVVFLIEFVAKVGAHGFGIEYVKLQLFHRDEALGYVKKQAYIEDRWNQLDCFLLTLTVADEIISHASNSTSIARMFRAGRVLRPLRILNHNHEMKLILSAVAQSLPHVGNVFGLCAIVYIIFGVVGRSLFSGQFFSCNDSEVATMDECVGFFLVSPDGVTDPSGAILMPRVWSNARFSFDNIGAAFLTLLEMTSLKWIDKTFMAMDITGPSNQPEQDKTPFNAIFFILYVYIGSLFVIRLFVGVLVEQFQRNNGTQILTESQKSWVDLEKFVLLLKPLKRIPRPPTKLQDKLYDLCQHRYFGRTIAVAILLNVALLLFNPNKSSDAVNEGELDLSAQSTSFEAIEMLFLAVFLTEAALKCLAFRHHYILSSTGAFELLILGGSLVAYSLATGIHGLIQAGRVFRMMRVLRFVRLNRGVYAVFQTFRASLKPIGHIFFLLFMIFFIFAVVGRQLFGGVRLGENMNGSANFRSFSSSFLLLFQIMAGDDWHLTMTDCMQTKPFCVERENLETGKTESDCGNPVAAVFYFVTYITLVVFFLLNLFIAVVLENFRSCYLQDDVCPISLQDFETYKEVFMKYDVEGRGSFPLWQLGSFLRELPPGLRVDKREHRAAFLQLRSQAQALLESWQQQRCKRPFFNELLRALCIHQLGIRCLPYEQQRDRVKQIFIYRAKVADMLVEATMKGYVQRWRTRKERDKMDRLRDKMVPEMALRTGGSLWSDRQEPSARVDPAATTRDSNTSLRPDKLRRVVVTSFVEETVMTALNHRFTALDTDVTRSALQEQQPGLHLELEEPPSNSIEEAMGSILTETQDAPAPDSPEPSSPERHRHKHRHKHKHKKKHKHKDKHAMVTPARDDEADAIPTDDPIADEQLVPKFDQPLYAPRRLPKITHKVVPTG